jgi:hypothetical protein
VRALTAVLAVALLAQQTSSRRTAFDWPISNTFRVRGTATYRFKTPSVCCTTALNVSLVDRQNPSRFWTIADLLSEYEVMYTVERADERSLVLSRLDPDYGVDRGSVKLFFDTRSKRLHKQIDFETVQDLSFANDAQAQAAFGISADGLASLRARRIFSAHPDDGSDRALPALFVARPLPQSTYLEFARARPKRVEDGYVEDSTRINEAIGPYQQGADGFWFGKTFYDGEGVSGVGGIGSVNAAGVYQMIRIPELIDWSVSALLVEGDTIWVGRVAHPEAADSSGGLLEYNLRSRRARVHPMSDVIISIARAEGALFLGTTHGVYLFRGGARLRYRMEPDIKERMTVVVETLR